MRGGRESPLRYPSAAFSATHAKIVVEMTRRSVIYRCSLARNGMAGVKGSLHVGPVSPGRDLLADLA